MNDNHGQPFGAGQSASTQAQRPAHGRRIEIGLDGQPFEVWDPEIVAEFKAMGGNQNPEYTWDDERP